MKLSRIFILLSAVGGMAAVGRLAGYNMAETFAMIAFVLSIVALTQIEFLRNKISGTKKNQSENSHPAIE
jgi:hypothetical protein